MKENRIRIYLNYLDKNESVNMTNALTFLQTGEKAARDSFLEFANELYRKENKFEFVSDNGHYPDCAWANYGDKHFTVVMQFKREYISEQGIGILGHNDGGSWDWRYFYGIAISDEERKIYALSYSNRCSPNWNNEYHAQRFVELSTIDFPLLTENGVIYRMDDSLHAAINARLAAKRPMFIEEEGNVVMTVRDQHGNYTDIKGTSLDSVFRDYADNYTGYRNYRRQMASEWEIVSDVVRERYEEWKKTAKDLKSSFDKFYGGGIVD